MTTDKEAAEAFEVWFNYQIHSARDVWEKAVEWATDRERERVLAIIGDLVKVASTPALFGEVGDAFSEIERRIKEG